MDKTYNLVIEKIKELSDSKKKEDQERYMKGKVLFYGISSPILNKIFRDLWKENKKDITQEDWLKLADLLIKKDYFEEKSFAILIFNKFAKKLSIDFLKNIELYFKKYTNEWATCDTLCSKVVKFMILNHKNKIVDNHILKWADSEFLWLRRAAAVSFVNIAKFGDYSDQIIEISSKNILSNERFIQLGTGWVLRELSLFDNERVVDFIKKNYNNFSREGLRYAIEKMDQNLRKSLLIFNI